MARGQARGWRNNSAGTELRKRKFDFGAAGGPRKLLASLKS